MLRLSGRRRPGRSRLLRLSLLVVLSSAARPQALPSAPQAVPDKLHLVFPSERWAGWLRAPYSPSTMLPSRTANSARVDLLIHDGKLVLSLQEAVALAIENNFDVELQSYERDYAAAEQMRASGGGLLRGIPTTIAELPSGEGGPGEPLLTTVGGYSPVLQLPSSAADLATITETHSSLSLLDITSLSPGSAIPQFDPLVSPNIELAQNVSPQPDPTQTGSNVFSSHTLGGGIGYSQAFSTGTALNLSYRASRLDEASVRFNIDPYISNDLNVTITQPLLQHFGTGVNRRLIYIARNESHIADTVFEQQMISTVSDTIRLYWDLVSLQHDLQVKRESLDAAGRLYQDTKNEVEQGTQAPVDLTAAAAQVASNRQAYINAQGMVLQQELLLKEVLTRRGISEPQLADATIEATTPIESPDADHDQPLSELIGQAMRQRPDLALAQQQEADARLALRGSRNQLLPELDLVASIENNGGAGTVNPGAVSQSGQLLAPPPANLQGGFGTAWDQVFSRAYPDYSVGLQMNLPIRNRVARADYARDEVQYRQSQVRLEQLQSQIRLQVGNALIAVQQARESYKAAVDARNLQEQALDVEHDKLEAGVATVYEYIEFQRNFAEAQSAEVTALGVFAKAKTALERAVGATLTNRNIVLDAAAAHRTP